jgi:hypothetical protein
VPIELVLKYILQQKEEEEKKRNQEKTSKTNLQVAAAGAYKLFTKAKDY